MAPKVIHLADEVHAAAKDYCTSHELPLKDWVSMLIARELRSSRVSQEPAQLEPQVNLKPRPAPKLETVQKKRQTTTVEAGEDDGPKPWEQPPFWKRAKEEPTSKVPEGKLEAGGPKPSGGGGAATGGAQTPT